VNQALLIQVKVVLLSQLTKPQDSSDG